VATPIGNAADITLRALRVLKAADVIACEDTRVTSKLLSIHQISAKLVAYHEHNGAKMRPRLIKRLKKGECVALVSDAGTPLISDPGYKLVQACIEESVPVTTLPGPSSVLAALVLSGLPTDRFFFAGFLPPRKGARCAALLELKVIKASLVFMESARRLTACLSDMETMLGPRPAAVGREITKKFEEVRRGTLAELASHYREAGPPKGEISIVVAPPYDDDADTESLLDQRLEDALARLSLREAVDQVTALTGLSRRLVYRRALEIKENAS
jgi:16S rRNA (cytidine1402-2'-O)-methyltransferase